MHNNKYSLKFISIALVVLLFSCHNTEKQIDFSTQIKPILNTKCITCHGGVKKSGGFSILFKEEAFAATESGKPAIVPGNASGSELIKRLHQEDLELRMPYGKPKLSDAEIDLLTNWIEQGAQWGEHWAYTLPKKIAVPPITIKASMVTADNKDFVKKRNRPFYASPFTR